MAKEENDVEKTEEEEAVVDITKQPRDISISDRELETMMDKGEAL